ncbi:MAG: PaaI family thioesterase [Desulfobacteraceae bacterium]|nr:PaaI family thioesterase [Desulfobacteraceae bacterium]MBC2752519.1 PaaI family thioesterase [Desulfobacteraceae bacterium]
MDIHTHHLIDQELCGQPVDLQPGYCRVTFTATDRMAADDKGLVHGGFIFGLADYAAMLAVNDPHVVLGAAALKFLKPVSVGDVLSAEARVSEVKGRKHVVAVQVYRNDETMLEGQLTCFVLDRHVLD